MTVQQDDKWPADIIHTNVTVHLDWRDRLKVLLGRTLHVDVRVEVEHQPGRTVGSSVAWVERLIPPRYHGGYAESPRIEATA